MIWKLPKRQVSAPAMNPEHKAVAAELTHLLYRNGLTSNIVVLAATAIMFYIFRDQLPLLILFAWSFYMTGAVGYRLRLISRYRKTKNPIEEHHKFRHRYLLGTAAVTIGWTVIAALGLGIPSFEYRLYIVLLMVSLLGAAIPILASNLLAIHLYTIPPVSISVIILFIHGGKDLVTGIALAIFALMILRSGKLLYKTLCNSITLRIQNETITEGLEKTVTERTLELEKSRDIAEKANSAKSEFLANMSHEIRTPMNAIIHFSQLALREKMSEESRDCIKQVHSSSKSLLRIINDILDLSKIESGKLDIEHTNFTVNSLLKEVTDSLRINAAKKGLALNIDMPDTLQCELSGDPLRVRQILTNLISNAIKFTEHGEITIEVREQTRILGNTVLEFRVIDTGIGMTDEQQKKLFQPFQQADTSTTRQYGGTGLGLYISKKIIEILQGTISVESIYGKGSTFSFRLPFEHADPEKDLEREQTIYQENLAKDLASIGGAEILVVEDNTANQVILTSILKNSNLQISIAENGKEALEKLNNRSFDLILMDIQMPVMDGYEATRAIRRHAKWAKLPIVAMTANAMQEDVKKCLDVGMNAHLSKPLELEKLHEALVKWITCGVSLKKKDSLHNTHNANVN